MTVKLQAPIQLELKISITDGEGRDGIVTIEMGKGQYLDAQAVRDRVAKFAGEEMPDGFRLMTKREWFRSLFGQCREEGEDGEIISMDWAMPGGGNWDE